MDRDKGGPRTNGALPAEARGFGELEVADGRRRAEEWALALASQGVSSQVRRSGDGVVLRVAAHDVDRARAILSAYVKENPPRRRGAPIVGTPSLPLGAAVAWALPLMAAFLAVGGRSQGSRALLQGSADAGRIWMGEWWRCVTALGLHADPAHLLSNSLVGGFFFAMVVRLHGAGLALLLVVASGALGNGLNALLQSPRHDSIGASTAVFGAIGILAGSAVRRRHVDGVRGRRAWLPVAAGLGLLAMLGSGGERVDIWAHLLGGLSGIGLGLLAADGAAVRRGALQWLAGGAAVAVILLAWWLALH